MAKAYIQHRFTKQTPEAYYITVDFSARLASGETLLDAGSTIVAVDKLGNIVSTTVLDSGKHVIGTPEVLVFVRAGDDRQDYKISLNINSSNGSNYEHDILMMVRNE